MKGVGRIYQQTFIDTYSKVSLAKLYDRKTVTCYLFLDPSPTWSFAARRQLEGQSMKRKRFSEEQIINILRQADAGKKPDELSREHGMSVGKFCAWKAKFGGMSVNEAQRLRTLENENRRLKGLVADQALNVRMLQSVVEKKR